MPQYNRRELDARAREYGFNRDTFEKVLRLRTILEFLNTHEYMCEHLLLKGGKGTVSYQQIQSDLAASMKAPSPGSSLDIQI